MVFVYVQSMKTGIIYTVAFCVVAFFPACKPGAATSGGKRGAGESGVDTGNEVKAESTNLVVLTAANFEQQVAQNDKLVMVDFWAPWCVPCTAIAPAVSELADDYAGKVTVGKVNVDNDGVIAEKNGVESLSKKYGVQSIPNIKFFKRGKVVDEVIGLVSKEVLEEKIKKHL